MKTWILVLLVVFLVPPALIAAGVLANRPPLTSPPGLAERLKTYLTSNRVETARESPYRELHPPRYAYPVARTRAAVIAACRELGWEVREGASGRIDAVITTPLWRFKDDLSVRVSPSGTGSVLHVVSRSRVGRGDLGANIRHILDLEHALERYFVNH